MMKFKVSSSALLTSLQSTSKVISSKNTIAILDSFLFNLEDSKLTITASDVETRLITAIELNSVEGSGLFAIEAKRLLDPLKEISEQPLSFEIDEEKLMVNVSYENGKFVIPMQKGDTYPQQKPIDQEIATSIQLESQILLSLISRTLFATGDDEQRPVMNGVYFDIQNENITFVSSDGHKLVCLRYLAIKSDNPSAFILPKKAANLLRGLLAKTSESVTLTFDENNAYIKTESFELVCRLIVGRYPKYESAIPTTNTNVATVDRLSFMAALKRVSLFSNPSTGLVKLQLSDNNIYISAQDVDFSTSGEENVVCQYTSEPLSIGFKASFLIEMLSNITSESILFQLGDRTRAGVLVPSENEKDEDLRMILMPMILSD